MATQAFTCEETLALDCIVCSASFSFPRPIRGRYPRFCSNECKSVRAKAQNRSRYGPSRYHRTCEVCERPFTASRTAAKYCSKDCRNRRPRPNKRPRPSGKHSFEERQCKACSGPYVARKDNDRLFCCDTCKEDWRRVTRAVSYRVYKRVRVEPVSRQCPDCGGVPAPKLRRCLTCRGVAKAKAKANEKRRRKLTGLKAAERKARKLRLRGVKVETVNLLKVLERDNWTCQLCGIKTPKKMRGTYDDQAPEVDHIIPIAEGGEHSYRNTQCACRKCNIAKSGTPKGQLRLFG